MIKHLTDDFETVEYDRKSFVLLYDNTDYEEYPLHWHDEIEVIMPLENNYYVDMLGEKITVHEGEVIIIPSCQLHHLDAVKGRRLIIQFDNMVFGKHPVFSTVMRSISSPVLINSDYDPELHKMVEKTIMEIFELYYSTSEFAEINIFNSFIKILIYIRKFQMRKQINMLKCDDVKFEEYNKMFNRVFKYIDVNYMYDITLEDLSKVSGYSKYHFSRIFKQYSSTSYMDYLNERRINAAEHMLLNSHNSITDIAVNSGFKSLATFNRIFKKVKKCTPTEFKKLHQDT